MDLPAYETPRDPAVVGGEGPEEALRRRAVRNLRRRAAFRLHALVYYLVNTVILGIWLILGVTNGNWFPWFAFVALGWGGALAIHGWVAYLGDVLSEDRIRAEMDRIAGR
jgi:hypothetical protein